MSLYVYYKSENYYFYKNGKHERTHLFFKGGHQGRESNSPLIFFWKKTV